MLGAFVILFTAVLLHVNAAPRPEQVHLAFHGNSTVMSVAWITMDRDSSTVMYGRDHKALSHTVYGDMKVWEFEGVTRYSHRALMTGLVPDSLYYYQIGTRLFQFRSLPLNPQSYKICIFGDLGYYYGNSTDMIIESGLKGYFNFIIHVGDLAYDLHTDQGRLGDKFMNRMEPLFSSMPYMIIAGNHEEDRHNFSNYQERFWMPHNGFHDNQFYSFDLGPAHFVGISTEFYGFYHLVGKGALFTQYNWLKKDLQEANANRHNTPWIISYQHRPFYCSNQYTNQCSDADDTFVRLGKDDMPGLEPLYIANAVDLNFCGHIHSYERMYPVANQHYYNGANAYNNPMAPIYVLTGAAGCHTPAPAFSSTPKPWSAARSNDYGYTILTVANKTHLHLEQRSVNKGGAVIDSVWITKGASFKPTTADRIRNPGIPFNVPCLGLTCPGRRDYHLKPEEIDQYALP